MRLTYTPILTPTYSLTYRSQVSIIYNYVRKFISSKSDQSAW